MYNISFEYVRQLADIKKQRLTIKDTGLLKLLDIIDDTACRYMMPEYDFNKSVDKKDLRKIINTFTGSWHDIISHYIYTDNREIDDYINIIRKYLLMFSRINHTSELRHITKLITCIKKSTLYLCQYRQIVNSQELTDCLYISTHISL